MSVQAGTEDAADCLVRTRAELAIVDCGGDYSGEVTGFALGVFHGSSVEGEERRDEGFAEDLD